MAEGDDELIQIELKFGLYKKFGLLSILILSIS